MLFVYGWVVVRTSRDRYTDDMPFALVDQIDDEVDAADQRLWQELRQWLEANAGALLKWQFLEQLNNDSGILQFTTSRNHRGSSVWDLMEWIARNGVGSYGIVYVHDDEDVVGKSAYGRGKVDHSNVFRVWRILNGQLEELDDPFLSPIVPRINPSDYA